MKRVLTSRIAWAGAGLLAGAGIVAYLLIRDTLFWWLGQAALIPLVALVIWWGSERAGDDGDWTSGASSGDGPWGAP